ncbi:leucine-rich protein [Crassisporium funariophilum]|nr:leucine-rich protein [Crassisporium funariophilum]
MEQEPGDDYLRRLATFIRTNERSLAEGGLPRRRRIARPNASSPSVFGWLGSGGPAPPSKPMTLSVDTHHLFYILMRLEALGYDIGTLDVHIESPSRPMSYVNMYPEQSKSETMSLAESFRSSFSAVSRMSLGGSWWTRPEPPSVDLELKYLYSSFTKLPALSVCAPGQKVIAELLNNSPGQNAVPLDVFKNVQCLECEDIDPRTLLGWDLLAESLRSLKIKKSGLEDVSDLFVGAVVDDQARREGSASRKRQRNIPRGPIKRASFHSTSLPSSVAEDEGDEEPETPTTADGGPSSPPPPHLSLRKWAFLKHLFLPDNSLTFFPAELLPNFTSLTHLDLSSNLLVSVPPGLGSLTNLASLNLSDNLIDSVLGIYLNLGQVLYLNLSRNRLESLCGLERLLAVERVDLRHNLLDESAEVGRLASLPNITELWVEGNPFTEIEEVYRITCFDYFWKEGKTIALDGTQPGMYEKRNLTVQLPEQMFSSRPPSTAHSPPVIAISHAHSNSTIVPSNSNQSEVGSSGASSPHFGPSAPGGVGSKARRKRPKRIVDLDGHQSDHSQQSTSHFKSRSTVSHREPDQVKMKAEPPLPQVASITNISSSSQISGAVAQNSAFGEDKANPTRFVPRSRHSRYQTEYAHPAPTFPDSEAAHLGSRGGIGKPNQDTTILPNRPSAPVRRESATLSSRSDKRRARVSASVFEAPSMTPALDTGNDADAYRKRIEGLKKDMGDGWLKVFSQSQQLKSPS